MIKDCRLYFQIQKSPIMLIGLFCLFGFILGCRRETDPTDVTIMFWTALSENNWEKAKKYSVKGSKALFDKNTRNIYLQTGTAVVNYDKASVETSINGVTASHGLSFKTYLVRIKENDTWKVDYAKTISGMNAKKFDSLLHVFKKIGSTTKAKVKEKIPWIKAKGKSILTAVKNWVKKRFKKLLD